MKALIIDDHSVSGMVGEICHIVLETAGHASQFIDARLVCDAQSSTSYTADMADQIVSAARESSPDWVMLVLQGRNSFGQMALATAIHEAAPAARFLFISGWPHKEELDYARSQGLKLRFEEMPFNPDKFLADIEKSI